jgi:hypothetical protein
VICVCRWMIALYHRDLTRDLTQDLTRAGGDHVDADRRHQQHRKPAGSVDLIAPTDSRRAARLGSRQFWRVARLTEPAPGSVDSTAASALAASRLALLHEMGIGANVDRLI